MVITTPHVVRSFLNVKDDVKPYDEFIKSTKSSITLQISFKGCKDLKGSKVNATDVECYSKRIMIGRVSACDICIPDDYRISRYHSAIECTRNGVWSFRDIGSKSGSALKPKPKATPKFGSIQPQVLDKKVPYILQNHDVILIGRVHHGHAHELAVTIHRPQDEDGKDGPIGLDGEKVVARRLTWRRSLHCNGCMGWGRRHSCSARFSQIQKMILECNQKSNVTAPRPPKTTAQKVLFHRVSGWWAKKPDKSVTFKVPKRYESDTLQKVGELPNDILSEPRETDEFKERGDGEVYEESDQDSEYRVTFESLSASDHETQSDESVRDD